MPKYYPEIEKRQYLLKEALAGQTRVPLLNDDERALYEEYNEVHSVIQKQQIHVKKSIGLCEYLLEVYDVYTERLQNLYDTMNSLDLNLNASYDSGDVRYKETLGYICWADKVEKSLREVLEFPKHQILSNEHLFYHDSTCVDETCFKEVFNFGVSGTNFDDYSSARRTVSTDNNIRSNCYRISFGYSLNIVSATWYVHNFNNYPVALNFPMESDIYSSFDDTDLTTFLHSYSEHLMAVHEHINYVTGNKNNLFSDYIGCKSISDSTTRYIKFVNDALNDLTSIDTDEIRSMIENGNQLKQQLSELKVYDSGKNVFGDHGKFFSTTGCKCNK